MSGKRIPELRFPGFEGEWEKKRLEDLVFFQRGFDITKSQQVAGVVPVVSSSGISSYHNESQVSGPGIVIGRKGSLGTVFYIATDYWPHDTTLWSKELHENHPKYVYYFISRMKLERYNVGSINPTLNRNHLHCLPICMPSQSEQKRIAAFLTVVDKRIALLQKKKEALERYKKGVMQKIFSQEIRFKDDEGRDFPDWEEKRLGEVYQVTRGNVLATEMTTREATDGNIYPVYSSQTTNKGLMGYFTDFLYENAITWTTDGANAGEVRFRKGKFYCTNVCGVLLSKAGDANPCTAQMINSVTGKYVSYVGNPKLMNGVMSNIKISFPSINEQNEISSLLIIIDDAIHSISQQLESNQIWKNGLLQQMFA